MHVFSYFITILWPLPGLLVIFGPAILTRIVRYIHMNADNLKLFLADLN